MQGPILWSLLLILAGVILLLDSFLLLEDFNAVALLPLGLVVIGAQILLRGDLFPSDDARTFGVTRGSVESATLEISSGEIDVQIRALQREGRLIAGQFAANARPALNVRETYAHIKMNRASTSWLSFADWQIALAQDLPWQILLSTYLGQVALDLSDVIVHDAVVATGFGDIRFVAPPEAFGTMYLKSSLGNIHVVTPQGYRTRILVEETRIFSASHDIHRYENPEKGVFLSSEYDENAPLVEIHISGTFGDAYLT
jgi:hypothetical protein